MVREDWAEEGRGGRGAQWARRAQPTLGGEGVVGMAGRVTLGETMAQLYLAAPASSSSATKEPPATTKAAPRTTTTIAAAASRARPARTGCRTPRTSAYARKTTTARLTPACTRASRALRVPPDPRETPSRVATRRRARLDRRHRRHRRPPPPKTRRRRLRRRATRSSPTSPTRD